MTGKGAWDLPFCLLVALLLKLGFRLKKKLKTIRILTSDFTSTWRASVRGCKLDECCLHSSFSWFLLPPRFKIY